MPCKSLVARGEDCIRGKKSKDRLNVMFCCSMTGEKLPPLIIGKATKPCFKNVDISLFNVTWKANKKAWVNSGLFEECLRKLDANIAVTYRITF